MNGPRVTPQGLIIAVCGLHGGAGTTHVATLLANAAARTCSPVLLTESDPIGGALGLHLGLTTDYGLADLAAAHAGGSTLAASSIRMLSNGLRISAGPPAIRDPLHPEATEELLLAARCVNALTILDAGHVNDAHAQVVLPHAQHVIWTAAADTDHRRAATVLGSALTTAARSARWTLVISDVGRGRATSLAAELTAACPAVGGTVVVPELRTADSSDDEALLAARQMLAALQ